VGALSPLSGVFLSTGASFETMPLCFICRHEQRVVLRAQGAINMRVTDVTTTTSTDRVRMGS
jgi:hypothetical protein